MVRNGRKRKRNGNLSWRSVNLSQNANGDLVRRNGEGSGWLQHFGHGDFLLFCFALNLWSKLESEKKKMGEILINLCNLRAAEQRNWIKWLPVGIYLGFFKWKKREGGGGCWRHKIEVVFNFGIILFLYPQI